jgi:hypothetical protein
VVPRAETRQGDVAAVVALTVALAAGVGDPVDTGQLRIH